MVTLQNTFDVFPWTCVPDRTRETFLSLVLELWLLRYGDIGLVFYVSESKSRLCGFSSKSWIHGFSIRKTSRPSSTSSKGSHFIASEASLSERNRFPHFSCLHGLFLLLNFLTHFPEGHTILMMTKKLLRSTDCVI